MRTPCITPLVAARCDASMHLPCGPAVDRPPRRVPEHLYESAHGTNGSKGPGPEAREVEIEASQHEEVRTPSRER